MIVRGEPNGRRQGPIQATPDKRFMASRTVLCRVLQTCGPMPWTFPQSREEPLDVPKIRQSDPKGCVAPRIFAGGQWCNKFIYRGLAARSPARSGRRPDPGAPVYESLDFGWVNCGEGARRTEKRTRFGPGAESILWSTATKGSRKRKKARRQSGPFVGIPGASPRIHEFGPSEPMWTLSENASIGKTDRAPKARDRRHLPIDWGRPE